MWCMQMSFQAFNGSREPSLSFFCCPFAAQSAGWGQGGIRSKFFKVCVQPNFFWSVENDCLIRFSLLMMHWKRDFHSLYLAGYLCQWDWKLWETLQLSPNQDVRRNFLGGTPGENCLIWMFHFGRISSCVTSIGQKEERRFLNRTENIFF